MLILVFDDWCISSEIAIRWIELDLIDDKSTLVPEWLGAVRQQAITWAKYWPRSMLPYGVIRPQSVHALLCFALVLYRLIYLLPDGSVRIRENIYWSNVQVTVELYGQDLWNTLSKAVPGKFQRSGGLRKRKCLQDRTNFHRFRVWQIVLFINNSMVMKPSYKCPGASEVTLQIISKYNTWIHIELTYNLSTTTHSKTVRMHLSYLLLILSSAKYLWCFLADPEINKITIAKESLGIRDII